MWIPLAASIALVVGLKLGGYLAAVHAIKCCKCSRHIAEQIVRVHGIRCLHNLYDSEKHAFHPDSEKTKIELPRLN